MKKICFLIPPEIHYIESNVSRQIEKGREFRQKLGILAVAGYLRERTAYSPYILDALAEGYDPEDVEKLIAAEKPDLVGFSVLTFNLLDCLDAAKRIKRVSPSTKICFGGFHPTIYPGETIDFVDVDYVVYGDGEITFAELICTLFDNDAPKENDLAAVQGLGWKRRDGGRVLNLPRPMATRQEYDDFPMPAHDLLNIDKYSVVLSDAARVASIQTSRGCPAKCTFCDIRQTKYRYRGVENILAEIRFLINIGVQEFFVVDDTFTINRGRTMELARRLVEEKLDIRYKISSRVDSVDPEMLDALARSGCYRIHFGVESGSQRLLDYLQKEITLEQVEKTFEMTKRAGIEPYAYMMIGIPTETREEIYQSMEFVKHIDPYHANFSVCTPFPKTKLYQDMLRLNDAAEDYWQDFAENPDPAFKLRTASESFSSEELRQLQDEALRSFYRSPRRILREIVRTRSLRQLVRKASVGMRILFPANSPAGPAANR